jgi:glutathione synthase/RimK-type ligase-like ATP-grasp enzyme
VIVLWGVPGDGPLDAIQTCLVHIGADFRLLDQRDAARSDATMGIERRALMLVIEGARDADRLDFKHVGAAYLRPIETERALPPELACDRAARMRAADVDRALIAWADLSTALVVNPPAAMAVNNSKPYQLRLVAEYGFAVPDTLVTTDPAAVRSFAVRHDRLIYKSVSGTRSIVNVLSEAGWERIEDVANAPTQFQEYVPGFDVRVHVVGDEVFASEVKSDAHDYRYASLSGNDVELTATTVPAEVADRCRAMAVGMGLAVAGIDLRHTPDGRWVCFEVNPSPAFVYYEEATGQPIGQAIARLLICADRARVGRGTLSKSRV